MLFPCKFWSTSRFNLGASGLLIRSGNMTGSWVTIYPICSTNYITHIYGEFFPNSTEKYFSGEALYMVLLPSQSQGAAARPSSWLRQLGQLHATKATCFCMKK